VTLLNEIELANTRRKLGRLQDLYHAKEAQSGGDEELREMTLESLARLINQLKEEIIYSEIHQPTGSKM
jgi:hypothetical protein